MAVAAEVLIGVALLAGVAVLINEIRRTPPETDEPTVPIRIGGR